MTKPNELTTSPVTEMLVQTLLIEALKECDIELDSDELLAPLTVALQVEMAKAGLLVVLNVPQQPLIIGTGKKLGKLRTRLKPQPNPKATKDE